MTANDPNPKSFENSVSPPQQNGTAAPKPPGFFRCLLGSSIAGALTSATYALTKSIATTFANKPIVTDKVWTANIASAVRTLVVGGSALATFVFAFAAIGLLALAFQVLFQKIRQPGGSAE